MDFKKSIKQSIEILRLNKKTIISVAKDNKATATGIMILVLASLISGLSSKNLVAVSITPVFAIIFSFIGVGVLHLTAILFKGKGRFIELYRVIAHASILNSISVLRIIESLRIFVSLIIIIWGFAVYFVIVKEIYKTSTTRTVFIILIPIIISILLLVLGMTVYYILNPGLIA